MAFFFTHPAIFRPNFRPNKSRYCLNILSYKVLLSNLDGWRSLEDDDIDNDDVITRSSLFSKWDESTLSINIR